MDLQSDTRLTRFLIIGKLGKACGEMEERLGGMTSPPPEAVVFQDLIKYNATIGGLKIVEGGVRDGGGPEFFRPGGQTE
jgi:hypothetical protein